jgi:hypothetical protein
MGIMEIMDRTGHTSITWDPDVSFEVKIAKEAFDKAIKEKYQAFEVDEDDEQGSRMTTFNPKAGKVMLIPQLQGG